MMRKHRQTGVRNFTIVGKTLGLRNLISEVGNRGPPGGGTPIGKNTESGLNLPSRNLRQKSDKAFTTFSFSKGGLTPRGGY